MIDFWLIMMINNSIAMGYEHHDQPPKLRYAKLSLEHAKSLHQAIRDGQTSLGHLLSSDEQVKFQSEIEGILSEAEGLYISGTNLGPRSEKLLRTLRRHYPPPKD